MRSFINCPAATVNSSVLKLLSPLVLNFAINLGPEIPNCFITDSLKAEEFSISPSVPNFLIMFEITETVASVNP